MLRSLLCLTVLCCLASVLPLSPVQAQDRGAEADTTRYYQYYRADESLYFKGRLGLNFYGGDRDINPDNELQKYIENIGFSLGLEAGYHFSPRFSLGLMHLSGRYPRIEDNRPEPAFPQIDQDQTSKWRHHFSLVGRSYVLPNSRVTPYGQLGLHVGFGKINDEIRSGLGPFTGIGLDAAVSDRAGIFLELNGLYSFGDDKLDLADTEVPADASDFDSFTFFGFGLRLNMKSPFVPVTVECTAPQTLLVGESGTFAATINEDATRPVEIVWDLGDGTMGRGLLATHAYTASGQYQVSVTASNRRSSDTALCPVRVLAPPRILTLTATPNRLDNCEPLTPVRFAATTEGDQPITYLWDFGDGTTSTQQNPTHTYGEPGTYTVTLSVSNAAGTDTRSTTVTVDRCVLPICQVTEMNSVFFDRNSSVLTPQAQEALRENLDILAQCPEICVEVVGYASRDERNPDQLAEDRARAVAQFYQDGGIGAERIQMRGVGAQGQTTKKGGATQFRRVDTLPGRCVGN
ncbi:MAG: PKD domain-containing protein [Rhodothermales bacterium]|nr:PKD domain-containing protein [Rhodothermales bacterium]